MEAGKKISRDRDFRAEIFNQDKMDTEEASTAVEVAMMVETGTMSVETVDTEVMRGDIRAKGCHLNPPTPKMERGSSEAIRPTTTDLGRY